MGEECKLYVRNLPWSVEEQNLREIFSKHGEPSYVRLCTERDTGRSRGFGFVSYADKASAEAAMKALDGFEVDGRNIAVREAEGRPAGNDRGGNDRGDRGGYGDRGEKVCFSFQRGQCKFGDTCKFSHGGASSGGRPQQQRSFGGEKKACFAFQRDGSCKFGDTCRFAHDGAESNESKKEENPKRVSFDSDDEDEVKPKKANNEPASEPVADKDEESSDSESEDEKEAPAKKRDAAESSDSDSSSDEEAEEKPKKKKSKKN
mmetsp:Transcript_9042/g.17842  ORF Transcript_9042/g.17842 Transcript_9042/m.17842 type:complete len:261 (+) Transcript_9042:88-870(+)